MLLSFKLSKLAAGLPHEWIGNTSAESKRIWPVWSDGNFERWPSMEYLGIWLDKHIIGIYLQKRCSGASKKFSSYWQFNISPLQMFSRNQVLSDNWCSLLQIRILCLVHSISVPPFYETMDMTLSGTISGNTGLLQYKESPRNPS